VARRVDERFAERPVAHDEDADQMVSDTLLLFVCDNKPAFAVPSENAVSDTI
jgi:hypothetical protein